MATVASAPDAAVYSRRFTAEEDSALLCAVRVRGTKWTKIVGSLVDSGEQYAALARFGAQQLAMRFVYLRRAEGTKAAISVGGCYHRHHSTQSLYSSCSLTTRRR